MKKKIRFDYWYRNSQKTKYIDTADVVMMMNIGKYGRQVAALRERVWRFVAEGVEGNAADECQLPAVCWADGEDGYTGLVTLTLPFGENKVLGERIATVVKGLPQVMCSYVSASGRKMKVVIPYMLPGGELPGDYDATCRFHDAAHRGAAAFLMQATGVRPEDASADYKRGHRISSDACIYYNPEALSVPLLISDEPRPLPEVLPTDTYNTCRLPEYDTLQMQITKFNVICRKQNYSVRNCTDEHLFALAAECRKAGIEEEVAVKCLLMLGDMMNYETLVRTTFENVYAEGRFGKAAVLPKALLTQMSLRHFLKKRYLFRRNVITDSIEYMERSRHITDWHPLTERARNTICMNAQMALIEVWDKDLERLLQSDFIYDYDPILDFVYHLPQWDGEDRITPLAQTVKTDDENWCSDFSLWLRSMVSQWTGRGGLYGSSIVLMLAGGQGTGKSTFLKRLLPTELSAYYNDRIDFTNKREAERALMRFALLNMDEYDQVTSSQAAYLKHILQKSDVKWRKMYQDDIEQRHRYAAFCATTNSLTPLTDPTGSRRYLCVEVLEKIDNTREIDYQQLYAQVEWEIRHGQPSYFSVADEKRIQQRNLRFYQYQPLEMILNMVVRKPEEGEDGEWANALDIANMVHSIAKGIRVDNATIMHIGRYLMNNGYKRRRTHDTREYKVVPLQATKAGKFEQ